MIEHSVLNSSELNISCIVNLLGERGPFYKITAQEKYKTNNQCVKEGIWVSFLFSELWQLHKWLNTFLNTAKMSLGNTVSGLGEGAVQVIRLCCASMENWVWMPITHMIAGCGLPLTHCYKVEKQTPGSHCPVRLVKRVSFRFSRKLYFKGWGGER